MSNNEGFPDWGHSDRGHVSLQSTQVISGQFALIYARTLRHAADQAALRARIGQMPSAAWWRSLENADVSAVVGAVQAHPGLARWAGLPANPGARAVERHLNGALRRLAVETGTRLPRAWNGTVKLLRMVPDILWLDGVLGGADVAASLDRDSELHELLKIDPERRGVVVQELPLGRFAAGPLPPLDAWWQALRASPSPGRGVEGRALASLLRLVDGYLRAREAQAQEVAVGAVVEPELERLLASGRCPLRDGYVARLRVCLAGDPFHAVLPLIYLLLELDQMTTLRAVLLRDTYRVAA